MTEAEPCPFDQAQLLTDDDEGSVNLLSDGDIDMGVGLGTNSMLDKK